MQQLRASRERSDSFDFQINRNIATSESGANIPQITISTISSNSESDLSHIEFEDVIFTREELDRLRKRFQKIDADSSGKIDKIEFFSIPGVANNPLGMRIMDVLDSDKNGMISFDEFINGLSIFLTANKGGSSVDKNEKLKFAFKIFDIDNDGYISNGELFVVLKMMIGENISDNDLQDLVDRTITEADVEYDQRISFEEFVNVIKTTDVEKSLTLDFDI